MCYNLAAKERIKALQDMYGVRIDYDYAYFDGYYQISGFAHPKLPVLTMEHPQGFELMQWGLIPSWAMDEKQAKELSDILNAKAETIFEKKMFRKLIMSKRCILPVEGFYEWRDIAGKKFPYYISPNVSPFFTLGCIYDSWVDETTGEVILSLIHI